MNAECPTDRPPLCRNPTSLWNSCSCARMVADSLPPPEVSPCPPLPTSHLSLELLQLRPHGSGLPVAPGGLPLPVTKRRNLDGHRSTLPVPIIHLWVPEESEKVNSLGTGLAVLDGRSWGDMRELLCIRRSSPLTFPNPPSPI